MKRLDRTCGRSWSSRDDGVAQKNKPKKTRKVTGTCMRCMGPSERSHRVGMFQSRPGLDQCNPLVHAAPRVPPTRPHACLPVRPAARSPVHSLVRLPARPLAFRDECAQKLSAITERILPSLARACSSVPRTTGPRHGPTLCVPTQSHPCTCSPACPSSPSVSARPPGNGVMLSRKI